MDTDLPTVFDLIVVGTGMTESMVAAAASRIDKTVLHLDSNEYYGSLWASFTLDGIEKLVSAISQKSPTYPEDCSAKVFEGEKLLTLSNSKFQLSDLSLTWHILDKAPDVVLEEDNSNSDSPKECPAKEADECSKENKENMMKNCRKFNLDLSPRLQLCRGDFVELLISSNIARYSEYRSVSRILTLLNGNLEEVPCSRSDVFNNDKVSIVEKRLLMKLLNFCLDADEETLQSCSGKLFCDFLKEHRLTDQLMHYVIYSIAMCKKDTPCLEGIQRTKRFLHSLGRFGKTPFIFSMYGSGELPQAFCRMCAVFGGLYCLGRPIHGIVLNANQEFDSIICGSQRIKAKSLVMGLEHVPDCYVEGVTGKRISRAIFITNKSIQNSPKEHLTMMMFPQPEEGNIVRILELGPTTGTCPANYFVVHMISEHSRGPENDFRICRETLFKQSGEEESDKPEILWSLYFTTLDTSTANLNSNPAPNIFLCSGPDSQIDLDFCIQEAKSIFSSLYGESPFLPRAPDPEEIVFDDAELPVAEAEPAAEAIVAEVEAVVAEFVAEAANDQTPKAEPAEMS